jgi:hypothetical protein
LSDVLCSVSLVKAGGSRLSRAERREGVRRTSGWSAALARTLAVRTDCVRPPPAPAATVLAYTPGDRTSPAPQAMHWT